MIQKNAYAPNHVRASHPSGRGSDTALSCIDAPSPRKINPHFRIPSSSFACRQDTPSQATAWTTSIWNVADTNLTHTDLTIPSNNMCRALFSNHYIYLVRFTSRVHLIIILSHNCPFPHPPFESIQQCQAHVRTKFYCIFVHLYIPCPSCLLFYLIFQLHIFATHLFSQTLLNDIYLHFLSAHPSACCLCLVTRVYLLSIITSHGHFATLERSLSWVGYYSCLIEKAVCIKKGSATEYVWLADCLKIRVADRVLF